MPPVTARKIEVPTTTSRAAADDGRFKVRVVTPGRMQMHYDTECAIVIAKDKSDRSQNGALYQRVK